MSADEASVVGIKLGQALAAVHGAGLLHRDVKARNVMRESGGRIVLMDFGAGRELVPTKPSKPSGGRPLGHSAIPRAGALHRPAGVASVGHLQSRRAVVLPRHTEVPG
jgi:serine/threonine protein kinase